MRSSGASAAATRSSSRLARWSASSDSAARGSARWMEEASPARSFASSSRKVASARVEPRGAGARPRPAQERLLQGRDRRQMGAWRRTEPRQRMLEEREQLRPVRAARARRSRPDARTRRRRSPPSGSPPESSAVTFQRSSVTRTRRASARSGVTRAAVRCRRVERLAQRDSDGERLLLDIRGLDHGDGVHRPGERADRVRRGEAVTPAVGRGGGAQRFAQQHLAAMRRRQARA